MDQQVKTQQQKIYGPFKGNKINTAQNTEGGVPPAARPFNSCLCLCLCLFVYAYVYAYVCLCLTLGL